MDKKIGLSIKQQLLACLILALWLIVFTGGLLISSAPYRELVVNHDYINISGKAISSYAGSGPSIFWAWILVILCFTPTNVLFLCMSSGILGSLSRIAILHSRKEGEREIPQDNTNPVISGAFRGMFAYLLIISGVLIINETPFTSPSQFQYARLAGFMSLFSFLLSYDPSRFRKFLKTANDQVDRSLEKGNKG